jgi:hypothetical protein
MPEPSKAPRQGVAVVGNPAKISRAFLSDLKAKAQAPVFIDRRYVNKRARERIENALQSPCRFISPKNHLKYLKEIDKYEQAIDTFPYSGGLTAVELLILNINLDTKDGCLFSSRHVKSHKLYFAINNKII